MSELEEVNDLENVILEDTSNQDNKIIIDHGISFEERLNAFEKEWVEFLKKEITANIQPWFHLWFRTVANGKFILKMEKLANKHFRGILGKESLMRLQIFVKQLQYGIIALQSAVKKPELETILKFVEVFSNESFEAMEHWNWPLVHQNMARLTPYTEEDLKEEEEDFDPTKNGGFPSWIKFSVGECDCECEANFSEKSNEAI